MIFRLLLVEDDPDDARILQEWLDLEAPGEWEPEWVRTIAEAREAVEGRSPDVVLLDLSLPDSQGLETLTALLACAPGVPIVILTGNRDDSLALEAVRRGAQDFVLKSRSDVPALLRSLQYGIERKRHEARLRGSEARFRTLFERAPVGLVLLDASGRVQEVNRRFLAMVGLPREAVASLPFLALVAPEDAPGAAEWLARASTFDESTVPLEVRFPREGGSSEWGALEAATLPGGEADPELRMVAVESVTWRRHVETQLQRAHKMEALGRLAGGVAHDFNNLLTAIMGYAGLVRGRLIPGSAEERDLDQVLKATHRATALTQQLLFLGRRQFGRPQPVRFGSVLEDLAEMLGRLCGEAIEVRLEVRAPEAHVLGDRAQLEQVVLNLVLNARDAMPRGGVLILDLDEVEAAPPLEAGLPALPSGRYACLTVTDEGEGMDEAVQSQLFEPFFTTKGPDKGTGLGLPTVYGIVTQSRGFVTVRSAPGEGSTFRVFLPLTARRPEDAEPPAAARKVRTPLKILLVEDDAMLRRLIPRLLQSRGWQVLAAQDGEAALELAGAMEGPADLVISDVILPGLSGGEVVESLRERWPTVPVLFISGYNPDAELQAKVDRDEVDFLAKPFSSEDLLERVRRAVARGRPGAELS